MRSSMNEEQKTGLYLRQMEQIHIYNVAIIQVMMVTVKHSMGTLASVILLLTGTLSIRE
jgi:hypothetical protein